MRGAGSSKPSKQRRTIPAQSITSAVLYAKMGQPNDAVAAFRYGIKSNPDDDELYLNLARIYVMMGEREKARGVLGDLLERKPGNATATKALSELGAR